MLGLVGADNLDLEDASASSGGGARSDITGERERINALDDHVQAKPQLLVSQSVRDRIPHKHLSHWTMLACCRQSPASRCLARLQRCRGRIREVRDGLAVAHDEIRAMRSHVCDTRPSHMSIEAKF